MDRSSAVSAHRRAAAASAAFEPKLRAFRRAAWATLAAAVLVILWGAVVRATGSGAGCGAHWPLCNGEIVPISPRVATLVEFAHRVSSGLLVLGAFGLAAAAWRLFPAGHLARRGAAAAVIFVLLEAVIGAGIVLLQLVDQNASALRAVYIAGHLVNTMLLVGALTATTWAARERSDTRPAPTYAQWAPWLIGGLGALLVVSAAGAVVALGDTLFPQTSLAAGLAADFNPASHVLVRLRLWHPLLAVAASLYLISVIVRSDALDEPTLRGPARAALAAIGLQILLGVLNVVTLAPLAAQMAHLVVSNLVWIALVWLFLSFHSAGDARPA